MNSRALILSVCGFILLSACQQIPTPDPFISFETEEIMPDTEGRISKDSNSVGIQGRWYSYAGKDSVIRPAPLEQFTVTGDKICTNGTASKIVANKYSLYYGAGIGFHMCYSDSGDMPPEFPYTLSGCPFSKLLPNMHEKIAGISFDLEWNIEKHPDIRVIFREAQREECPFVKITKPGPNHALIREAGFDYDPMCKSDSQFSWASYPAEIQSILFQVTNTGGSEELSFDFCISNLKLLMNPTEERDTNPYIGSDSETLELGTDCSHEMNFEDAGLAWIDVEDTENDLSFKILRTEVTARQFHKCQEKGCCMNTAKQFAQCDAEQEDKIGDWEICSLNNMQSIDTDGGYNEQYIHWDEPANCVNWYQAQAFCKWAGGHLPNEGEWEAAAAKPYPWGSDDPTCSLAVMDDDGQSCEQDKEPEKIKPEPVCSRTRSDDPNEICDMSGNVWEWVDAWYPESKEIPENTFRMLKGGSYKSEAEALKIQSRSMEDPAFPRDRGKIGFRCVK